MARFHVHRLAQDCIESPASSQLQCRHRSGHSFSPFSPVGVRFGCRKWALERKANGVKLQTQTLRPEGWQSSQRVGRTKKCISVISRYGSIEVLRRIRSEEEQFDLKTTPSSEPCFLSWLNPLTPVRTEILHRNPYVYLFRRLFPPRLTARFVQYVNDTYHFEVSLRQKRASSDVIP